MHIDIIFHGKCLDITKNVTKNALEVFFPKIEASYMTLDLDIEYAYDPIRKQYNAELILDRIAKKYKTPRIFLLIVPYNIYVPPLNFVFGVAYPGKGAIISTYMLRMNAGEDLFTSRLEKTIKHELGHVFGLPHCSNPCVMRFANSLFELDMKSKDFCPSCSAFLKKVEVI